MAWPVQELQPPLLDPDANSAEVLNISKGTHLTNENLYGGIFRVSDKIAARRMRPPPEPSRFL